MKHNQVSDDVALTPDGVQTVTIPFRCESERSGREFPYYLICTSPVERPSHVARLLAKVFAAVPDDDLAVLSTDLKPDIGVMDLSKWQNMAQEAGGSVTLDVWWVNNSCDELICSLFAHELGHVVRYRRRCAKPCPLFCPRPCKNCERFAHRYAARLGFPRVPQTRRVRSETIQKRCPECGRFMSQVIGSGYDPEANVALVADYECGCGHALFDTAVKQKTIEDQKDEYERETGFRPYR